MFIFIYVYKYTCHVPNSCPRSTWRAYGMGMEGNPWWGKAWAYLLALCLSSYGRWQLRKEFSPNELLALCIPKIILISFHLAGWQEGHYMGQREFRPAYMESKIHLFPTVFQVGGVFFLSTSTYSGCVWHILCLCLMMPSILLINSAQNPKKGKAVAHHTETILVYPTIGTKDFSCIAIWLSVPLGCAHVSICGSECHAL